jgi:hypothetical protein
MDFFDTQFVADNRPGTLLPGYITPAVPNSLMGTYSFGGMCDSYYEYLVRRTCPRRGLRRRPHLRRPQIKEHLLLGGGSTQFSRMYAEAIDSAYDHIIRDITTVPGERLVTVGEKAYGSFRPTMEHLVRSVPAIYAHVRLIERTDLLRRRHARPRRQIARPPARHGDGRARASIVAP